jgi:hypothetical protein
MQKSGQEMQKQSAMSTFYFFPRQILSHAMCCALFRGNVRWRILISLVLSLAMILLIASILRPYGSGNFAESPYFWETSASPRGVPLRIAPYPQQLLQVSGPELDLLARRILPPPSGKLSTSYCLHLLRLHGLSDKFPGNVKYSREEILRILTSSKEGELRLHGSAFVKTRFGLRYPSLAPLNPENRGNANESHRDQALSSLAEAGLPLTYPMLLGEEALDFNAVLRDSVANFHLKQEELPWTAVSYGLYLAPFQKWTNRFNETFSFDDMIAELVARPLQDGSCAGTHLVYAIAMLFRIDEAMPVLSPTIRIKARDRLRELVRAAIESQGEDGSWTLSWAGTLSESPGRRTRENTAQDRLLVTGHLAECMLYLPHDLRPSDKTLWRAGNWLLKQVREYNAPDEALVCPYTHALCAIRCLAGFNPPSDLYNGAH